jgi:alkanesulfonate monooxygenase SsuD/methylene tetrahydromethanopterin reductase-like flavin-dependent oxidoreductase (luciferase family)
VDGRFLQAGDTAGLRAEAARAGAEGIGAVFVSEGVLGDPVVLAAGLGPELPGLLLGVRIRLDPEARHPAVLARDLTSLDLVCDGRSVLCFTSPFTEELAEAISVCRALWRAGEARHDGPHFPVYAAANRSRPAGEGSPLVALDLTSGEQVPSFLRAAPDLLVRPATDDPAACRLERV